MSALLLSNKHTRWRLVTATSVLPPFGVGRYDRKRVHWASERSVGYGFLIGESVRNHPNLHPYQTGSKQLAAAYFFVGHHPASSILLCSEVVSSSPTFTYL